MRNHFGHVFSFIQKDCRISDPAADLKEGIYIVNVFKTKGRGAVALTCGSSFHIPNTKRRASKSPAFVV